MDVYNALMENVKLARRTTVAKYREMELGEDPAVL